MGTGVGQVGALAYHGNMNTLAHQSQGWHLWQVLAAPKTPPVKDTTKKGRSSLIALVGNLPRRWKLQK